MNRYLYRGVNSKLHAETNGLLVPKNNDPFEYVFKHDGAIKADGSAKFGNCEHNAVLRHELRQEGFPTSGISTTPLSDRARFYALEGGKYNEGSIYKIDRELLEKHKIKEYVVADWIPSPSVLEDKEVILVSSDFRSLPESIVVEFIHVRAYIGGYRAVGWGEERTPTSTTEGGKAGAGWLCAPLGKPRRSSCGSRHCRGALSVAASRTSRVANVYTAS